MSSFDKLFRALTAASQRLAAMERVVEKNPNDDSYKERLKVLKEKHRVAEARLNRCIHRRRNSFPY